MLAVRALPGAASVFQASPMAPGPHVVECWPGEEEKAALCHAGKVGQGGGLFRVEMTLRTSSIPQVRHRLREERKAGSKIWQLRTSQGSTNNVG